MYRPGDNDLNSASVSPPPKYLRASAFAAMAASSAAVPSWNPLEVKPITALTKIVFAPRNASFTRASANETGATSRKYPYVLPATRSWTRTGLVVFFCRVVCGNVAAHAVARHAPAPAQVRALHQRGQRQELSFYFCVAQKRHTRELDVLQRDARDGDSKLRREVRVVQLPAEHQGIAPFRDRLDRADLRVQLSAGDHGDERARRV
mmetsp:Transcript_13091/g.54981  ORF Transcript_13091/g.54981 Transcript_13091/m.54981 type:complete len:206 (+) Transcript_13091:1510-2127(+)